MDPERKNEEKSKLKSSGTLTLILIISGLIIILAAVYRFGVYDYLKGSDEEEEEEELTGETDSISERETGTDQEEEADEWTLLTNSFHENGPYVDDGISYYSRTGENYIEIYNGEEFVPVFMKGVNMGVGKPGHFPGELAISKEEYLHWFIEIAAMNANCIRVYTVQQPAFYEAFYEFNQNSLNPLFLFHGTWFDENLIAQYKDSFNGDFRQDLLKEETDTVDIIHGNCVVKPRKGHASGRYKWDISPWVAGWILGIEPDSDFVGNTNLLHPDSSSYEGTYFSAENVTAFEEFWAETADEMVSYETEKYKTQRPLTYTNWPTTDVLSHPSEVYTDEDTYSLNIENIKPTDSFKAGLFASYHIYPYYPNFLYTDTKYAEYEHPKGTVNPYMGYLQELIAQSHIPIMVGEFGLPTCKGVAHSNVLTGYDQGNHDEMEQGDMIASLMGDINEAGCAGGMIFTWQDEWFKRTWNTMDYTDPDRRAYWDDVMTNEQHFGLLDFVPGDGRERVIIDGVDDDWNMSDVLTEDGELSLSVKYDCAYLYLMVKKEGADWEKDKVFIPFDVTANSGCNRYEDLEFKQDIDFMLQYDGKENAELYVQEYYDRFLFSYKDDVIMEWEKPEKNSLSFNNINYLLERTLELPDRNETIPCRIFDGGKLVYGVTDYYAKGYNSIADFCFDGDVLEIRIPWLELNFRDPSTMEIEDDFWENGDFGGQNIEHIYIGVTDRQEGTVELKPFLWEAWDEYPYFERLRWSYYAVQQEFNRLHPLKQ